MHYFYYYLKAYFHEHRLTLLNVFMNAVALMDLVSDKLAASMVSFIWIRYYVKNLIERRMKARVIRINEDFKI